jgi:hypothetical protein
MPITGNDDDLSFTRIELSVNRMLAHMVLADDASATCLAILARLTLVSSEARKVLPSLGSSRLSTLRHKEKRRLSVYLTEFLRAHRSLSRSFHLHTGVMRLLLSKRMNELERLDRDVVSILETLS